MAPSSPFHTHDRKRSKRGMTLVEAMIALLILGIFLLGFLGSFIQSRKLTESSVLHAAATSLVYGIIEQLKMADYTALPDSSNTISVRLNQDTSISLNAIYTPAPGAPQGPLTMPSLATLATVTKTVIPVLPLSSVSGTQSQQLAVSIWLWIDEIPLSSRDVVEVKKMTLVYSYAFNDGTNVRTVCDREIFLRTKYDQ